MMSKVVILGASACVPVIVRQLREQNFDGTIQLLLYDQCLPYRRVLDGLANAENSAFTVLQPENFYDEYRVEILKDQMIARINPIRKKIFTEDHRQIDFDHLIISEAPEALSPDVKGTHRKGLLNLSRARDIKTLFGKFSFSETIAILSDRISGLQILSALSRGKSDLIMMLPSLELFKRMFPAEIREWFGSLLEQQGITIRPEEQLQEILGDSEIKAMRTAAGKIYGCDTIVFDDEFENLRLFQNCGFEICGRYLTRNASCLKIMDGVFVCDRLVPGNHDLFLSGNDVVLRDQSFRICGEILNKEIPCETGESAAPETRTLQFDFRATNLVLAGDCCAGDCVAVREHFDRDANEYFRIFARDNKIAGVLMINQLKELDKFLNFIGKDANLIATEAPFVT